MAWAVVQTPTPTNTNGSAASNITLATGSNVTSGNRILAFSASQAGSGSSVDDHTLSHTGTATVDSWTSVLGPTDTTDTAPLRCRIWTAKVTGTGTMTAKSTLATGTGFIGLAIREYSGLSTGTAATIVDVSASTAATANAAGTVTSPATGATTADNELVFSCYVDAGQASAVLPAAGSGFGHFGMVTNHNDVNVAIEDLDSGTSGGTETGSFGLSGTGAFPAKYVLQVVVVKLPTVAAATIPYSPRRLDPWHSARAWVAIR